MSTGTIEKLSHLLPWSGRFPWWVVLIEGVAAIVISLFLIIYPATAFVFQMIGVALIVEGIFTVYKVYKDRVVDPNEQFELIRAVVGITTGLSVFITPLLVNLTINREGLRVLGAVLATGLTVEGVIGLIGAVRSGDGVRALLAMLFLAIGILYYIQVITLTNFTVWIGIVLFFVGAVLLLYAYVLRQGHARAGRRQASDQPVQEVPEMHE